MTSLPRHLTEFPSIDSHFPFHMSINRLTDGYPAHRHDFFEFSLVIEGSGKEMINDDVHIMQPGTFTLVMPYQIHEIISSSNDPIRLVNCNFGMELFTRSSQFQGMNTLLFEVDEEWPAFFQYEDDQYNQVKSLIEDMFLEYNHANMWRKELITAKLIEVLITFDRSRRKQITDHKKVQMKKPEKTLIWDIIQFIHSNYRETLSLPIISEHFNLSISSVSTLFKHHIGQNFVELLHDIRIRHACSLLVSTDLNVTEVALESGFGSYKTFSRVFREHKKISPAQYRKNYTENSSRKKENGL
ncbi:AraC family transcriptional regulator [Halalkalibacter kiskunsagensis]|uniref:AraC family transcriptional regulator n=1 Tax=Halalkalibacter kiskunsagensis TaxID=1548599 RepID=A0ABV6KAV5_9BACI